MPHKLEVQFLKDIQQRLQIAEDHFRHTGRTTRFVESLKDGQVVITDTNKDVKRLEQLAREAGKDVIVLARGVGRGTSSEQVRFSHTYVTDKLARHFQEIQEWIEHIQHNEEKNYDRT